MASRTRNLLCLVLAGTVLLANLHAQTGTTTTTSAAEPVVYTGDVLLAGALLRPEGPGPWACGIIIHGSGPSDRSNPWARAVAELFVRRGVAVLLTDKRGCGESRGDWRTAGMDELAADIDAAVNHLATRSDIVRSEIGLIGLSQGGWIAPLVAARRPDVGFVTVFSGATVSYAEQSFLEMANTARQAGLPEAAVGEVLALNRAAGRFVLNGRWEDYVAVRASVLAGAARPIAESFPDAPDSPVWNYLRKVATFDPLPYWFAVDQPVFIAYGEEDERDNVPVTESVRRIQFVASTLQKPDLTVVVAPRVGHALWNDQRAFAPEITGALDAWLDSHVVRGR
jgi:pimeloyl-ACP methyl ester carboxylesterase